MAEIGSRAAPDAYPALATPFAVFLRDAKGFGTRNATCLGGERTQI
jgi:hypothetical protein